MAYGLMSYEVFYHSPRHLSTSFRGSIHLVSVTYVPRLKCCLCLMTVPLNDSVNKTIAPKIGGNQKVRSGFILGVPKKHTDASGKISVTRPILLILLLIRINELSAISNVIRNADSKPIAPPSTGGSKNIELIKCPLDKSRIIPERMRAETIM